MKRIALGFALLVLAAAAPLLAAAEVGQTVTPGLRDGGRCIGVTISSSAATNVVAVTTGAYSAIFVQNITAPSTATLYGSYASADISTAAATGAGIIIQGGDPAVTPRIGGSANIPLKSGDSFYFLCNSVGYACRATVCRTR